MLKESVEIVNLNTLLERGYKNIDIINRFVEINQLAWQPPFPASYLWTQEKIESHIKICSHLQFVALIEGLIVGTLSILLRNEEDILRCPTWDDMTDSGMFTTHDPQGDSAFGADLSIDPKFQSRGIAQRLVQKCLERVVFLPRKNAGFLSSRVPRFSRKNGGMSIESYVLGKPNKLSRDPELRIYQKLGFEIVKILPDYMRDPESGNYGVLICQRGSN